MRLGQIFLVLKLFLTLSLNSVGFQKSHCLIHLGGRAQKNLLQGTHISECSRRFKVDLSQWPLIAEIEKNCMQLEAFKKAAPMLQPDA